MRCGKCHEDDQTVQHVRNCYGVARARQALAEVTPPPKPERHETFGETRRRLAVCWNCSSKEVTYHSVRGRTVRCCPDHPKTSHPDYKESQ